MWPQCTSRNFSLAEFLLLLRSLLVPLSLLREAFSTFQAGRLAQPGLSEPCTDGTNQIAGYWLAVPRLSCGAVVSHTCRGHRWHCERYHGTSGVVQGPVVVLPRRETSGGH